jgi:TolA-binding protein
LVAERAGLQEKAAATYKQLFDIAKEKLDQDSDNRQLESQTLAYLKSLATRSTTDELFRDSLQLCEDIIQQRGELSEMSREARFYMGELYYLKKDFSAAAKSFRDYIRIYGPRQDGKGDFADGPLKADHVDDKTQQLHEAAIRLAHCWYLQSHQQNMVRAYEWVRRNMPHNNPYMAEASYWLAMELGKGSAGKTREGRQQLAEALWTNVVHPSLNFAEKDFDKKYHLWVGKRDERYADVTRYVKTAWVKAGDLFGQVGQHEQAAGILEAYLEKYPRAERTERTREGQSPDELYDMARYALGRQYIELESIPDLIDCSEPFVSGYRDSKFRTSALNLLGFHAGRAERYEVAIDAYATLLDEYGENDIDEEGSIVPVPKQQWLRQGKTNWNGIRTAVPKGLDLDSVRFALGFLYWNQDDWQRCAQTLRPFMDDPKLASGEVRPEALFMLGRSYFGLYDFANSTNVIQSLIREYPRFKAIQEAYVYAARGLVETENWDELDLLYRQYTSEWPDADQRARMDLYHALGLIGRGQAANGMANLKTLAARGTYEDVRADACYYVAKQLLADKPPKHEEALEYLERSVTTYSRETACLEAAKCCIQLKKWQRAGQLLDQATRNFPRGDPRVINEAKKLQREVLTKIPQRR